MTLPFIDTNMLVRFLTGDEPKLQEQATAVLTQVEAGTLLVTAPDTVIADTVYVLASKRLYNLPAATIVQLLLPIVRLPGFRLKNRKVVIAALQLFVQGSKFDDAMIIASMRQSGATILYSFDKGFDRIDGIRRLKEPAQEATGTEDQAA